MTFSHSSMECSKSIRHCGPQYPYSFSLAALCTPSVYWLTVSSNSWRLTCQPISSIQGYRKTTHHHGPTTCNHATRDRCIEYVHKHAKFLYTESNSTIFQWQLKNADNSHSMLCSGPFSWWWKTTFSVSEIATGYNSNSNLWVNHLHQHMLQFSMLSLNCSFLKYLGITYFCKINSWMMYCLFGIYTMRNAIQKSCGSFRKPYNNCMELNGPSYALFYLYFMYLTIMIK